MKKCLAIFLFFAASNLFGCTWQAPYNGLADEYNNGQTKPPFWFFPLIGVSESGHRMAVWQRLPDDNSRSTYAFNVLVYSAYDPISNQ